MIDPMQYRARILKSILALRAMASSVSTAVLLTMFILTFVLGGPAAAQEDDLDALFAELATADAETAPGVAERVARALSASGSPAMDLLLQRGRDAMDEDPAVAVNHFSALIDHHPDFVEAWNARATAYYRQELPGLAIDDLEQVLALEPRHFGALTGVAVILEDLGYDLSALKAWRAVREIYPAQPQAEEAIRRLELLVEGRRL